MTGEVREYKLGVLGYSTRLLRKCRTCGAQLRKGGYPDTLPRGITLRLSTLHVIPRMCVQQTAEFLGTPCLLYDFGVLDILRRLSGISRRPLVGVDMIETSSRL